MLLKAGLSDYFPNFWEIPANLFFLKKCLNQFILFPIILSILSFWYIRKKQYFKFILVFGGSLAYILLIHFSSPFTSHDYYSEVTYRALGLLVGLPLVFDLLSPLDQYFKSREKFGLVMLVFVFIIGFRLIFITYNGMHYLERQNALQGISMRLAEENNTCCTRLYTTQLEKELVINQWAIPYETLLSTALNKPDSPSTLFLDDDFMEVYDDLNTGEKFLTPFDQIRFSELNARFFRLGPDVYQLITPKD